MSPTLTKVVYKHDSDVYIIIVNPIEVGGSNLNHHLTF